MPPSPPQLVLHDPQPEATDGLPHIFVGTNNKQQITVTRVSVCLEIIIRIEGFFYKLAVIFEGLAALLSDIIMRQKKDP